MTLSEINDQLNRVNQHLTAVKNVQSGLNTAADQLGKIYISNAKEIDKHKLKIKELYPTADLRQVQLPGHALADSLEEAKAKALELKTANEAILKSQEALVVSYGKTRDLALEIEARRAGEVPLQRLLVEQSIKNAATIGDRYSRAAEEVLNLNKALAKGRPGSIEMVKAAEDLNTAKIELRTIELELERKAAEKDKTDAITTAALVHQTELQLRKNKAEEASLAWQKKIHKEQLESFDKTGAKTLELGAKTVAARNALSLAVGALRNALEFSGLAFAIKQVQTYQAAVQSANGTLEQRYKLINDLNFVQAVTGIQADKLVESQKALVEQGLDTLSNNRQNLETVSMLAATFGVQAGVSAKIAALSQATGSNFQKMGDTIAIVTRNSGLAASKVADIATAAEQLRFNLGGASDSIPDLVAEMSAFEGTMNRIGGPSGTAQRLVAHLTSLKGIAGAQMLGLGNVLSNPDMFSKSGDFTKAITSIREDLIARTDGDYGRMQVLAGYYQNVYGLTLEDLVGIVRDKGTDIIDASKQATDAITKQQTSLIKEFSDSQIGLGKAFDKLQSRFQAFLAIGLTPAIRGLTLFIELINKVTQKIFDVYEAQGDSVKGVIKVLTELVSSIMVASLAFSTLVAAMSLFKVAQGIGLLGGFTTMLGPLSKAVVWVKDAAEWFKVLGAASFFKEFLGLGPVILRVGAIMEGLSAAVAAAVAWIFEMATPIGWFILAGGAILTFLNLWTKGAVVKGFMSAMEQLGEGIEWICSKIPGLVKTAVDEINGVVNPKINPTPTQQALTLDTSTIDKDIRSGSASKLELDIQDIYSKMAANPALKNEENYKMLDRLNSSMETAIENYGSRLQSGFTGPEDKVYAKDQQVEVISDLKDAVQESNELLKGIQTSVNVTGKDNVETMKTIDNKAHGRSSKAHMMKTTSDSGLPYAARGRHRG